MRWLIRSYDPVPHLFLLAALAAGIVLVQAWFGWDAVAVLAVLYVPVWLAGVVVRSARR